MLLFLRLRLAGPVVKIKQIFFYGTTYVSVCPNNTKRAVGNSAPPSGDQKNIEKNSKEQG